MGLIGAGYRVGDAAFWGAWAVHEPPLRMGWYGAQLSPARYGQGFANRPYVGGYGPCVIDAPWAGVSEPWGDYGCGWRT